MKLWFLFVPFLFLFACQTPAENQIQLGGEGVLVGEFPDLANQQILIKGDDYTELHVDTIDIDDKGLFQYRTYLKKPEYFSLQINRSKVLLYLQPNDSISITGSVDNLPSSVRFSGNSSVYNDYLVSWIKAQLSFQSTISEVFGRDESHAVTILDSLKSDYLTILENFKTNFSGVDQFFYDTEKTRIIYTWALNMQNYPRNHAYVNKVKGYEASPNFYNFLGDLDLNNPEFLHVPIYRKFIEDYIYYQMEREYKKDSLVIESFGSYTMFRMHTLTEYIKDQEIRDFVSYTSMKNHVHYDGVKNYASLYPYFDSLCHDSIFIQDIQKDLQPWQHLHKGKPSKDFTYVNSIGDSIHLSDFRGKYVFIDVWATWCSPCLNEVPSLRKLESEMMGRNIVFVSISVDQDKEKWEEMLRASEFSGIQLYAGKSDILIDFYKISGIPRFMLIDPAGKIVEASSDRPSMNIGPKLMILEGM